MIALEESRSWSHTLCPFLATLRTGRLPRNRGQGCKRKFKTYLPTNLVLHMMQISCSQIGAGCKEELLSGYHQALEG